MKINLTNPNFSYIFGLFQADANFYENTRNRGRISLEINNRDKDILFKIKEILPCSSSITSRTRDTNFKKSNIFTKLCLCDLNIRNEFKYLGLPPGTKSDIIDIPKVNYSEVDYWRGIIDGDGSIGITRNNIPFVSLVTKSELLAKEYLLFLKKYINIVKSTSRNKRDNCFNICVTIENAKLLVHLLYYKDCLSINRKLEKAIEVSKWERPIEMIKKENKKKWEEWEDDYILENTVVDAMKKLGRSEKSIKTRLWRLTPLAVIKG